MSMGHGGYLYNMTKPSGELLEWLLDGFLTELFEPAIRPGGWRKICYRSAVWGRFGRECRNSWAGGYTIQEFDSFYRSDTR